MSKNLSKEIAMKLIYYLVVTKSSEWDYKYFKPKIVFFYYYMREIASKSIGPGG